MGKEKTTEQTQSDVHATPEEKELNRLTLERIKANNPSLTAVQGESLGLATDFLQGLQSGVSSSPILNRLFAGISPEVTSQIVKQSIEDIRPGLQASGLLDSGVRAELEARTAADIRRASEESNLNTLFNLLNISQGQAAQIQQPLLTQSGQLSNAFAGLRSTNTRTNTTAMNPFLKSFQQSLGEGLGGAFSSGVQGAATGGFSGFRSGFGGA